MILWEDGWNQLKHVQKVMWMNTVLLRPPHLMVFTCRILGMQHVTAFRCTQLHLEHSNTLWKPVCLPTDLNLSTLTFLRPVFEHTNAHKKTPLEIRFISLGNKEIYCTFKTCCIISVLFPTKCRLLHNFIIFCLNNTFFINRALTFKYPSW
jgi:hypothetical protein